MENYTKKKHKLTNTLEELLQWCGYNDYCEEGTIYPCFYHYTKAESAKKIVGDKIDFMFTRGDKFLDKNEGYHILEPYYWALGHLYNRNLISKEFYKLLSTVNLKVDKSEMRKVWVFCFSSDGNSKYMKERYAPNDGYVLGVDSNIFEILESCFSPEEVFVEIYCVNYSLNKLKQHLITEIKNLYKCYKKDKEENNYNTTKELNNMTKKIIVFILNRLQYFYKSSSYKNENEIRVLCTVSDEFTGREGQEDDDKVKLYFYPNTNRKRLHISIDKQYLWYCDSKLEKINSKEYNTRIFKANNEK